MRRHARALGEARVVGRDEDGAVVGGDRGELLGDRGRAGVVEVGGRLVEDEERRIVDERSRERDALPLAAGEALRVDPGHRGEPEALQEHRGALLVLAGARRRGRAAGARSRAT